MISFSFRVKAHYVPELLENLHELVTRLYLQDVLQIDQRRNFTRLHDTKIILKHAEALKNALGTIYFKNFNGVIFPSYQQS